MRALPTRLAEVLVIEPDVYRDDRGFFLETFHAGKYHELGISTPFVQDNHSRSRVGTLRGLHLQDARQPQGKLIRVVHGSILDVAVDIRRDSPSFGQWVMAELSAENFRQMYIPIGFAHGFYVTEGPADVEYKCTAPYDACAEVGIVWNDPDIAIDWPNPSPLLSPKDAALPRLASVLDRLPRA